MREIKFRAWDKKKEMWTNYKSYDGILYFMDKNTGVWFGKYNKRYKDFDLMQYIGMKDMNNVEIYEGDIVKLYKEKGNFKDTGVVKFDKSRASFVLETQDDDYGYFSYNISYYNYNKVYYKVIGNIYENKELLEQE